MKKVVFILAAFVALSSCQKEEPTPNQPAPQQACNCGTIIEQGNHNTSNPAGYLIIRNDCSGNIRTQNTSILINNYVGNPWCLEEGESW